MKNMNVIYVNFEQEKEKNFFHIPVKFDELKASILDEWDYLDEKGLIIEDINHNIIKNQNDFLRFKENSKEELILNIKYNGNYQKKPDLSIKEIVNKINSNNEIYQNYQLSNKENKNLYDDILEKINNLNEKMENLNKDIEFIKNNKIDLKKRITNINKSINESREIIKNMIKE